MAAEGAGKELECSLLSLPMHVVETVVGFVQDPDKKKLMLTCKALRRFVLQQPEHMALRVHTLGSDHSFKEAVDVLTRREPIESLNLVTQGCRRQQEQLLLQELATRYSEGGKRCAVKELTVSCHLYDMGSWAGTIGPAFTSISGLQMSALDLDAEMLQGLSACTQLEKLTLHECTFDESVTHLQLASWLPAVRTLILYPYKDEQWLPALAPQLTKLVFDQASGVAPDAAELARCEQLVEVDAIIGQAQLDALLGLPNLNRVISRGWEADAKGHSCSWGYLELDSDPVVAMDLPRGIKTLGLTRLRLDTDFTPGGSLEGARAVADMIRGSCQDVQWCGPGGKPQLTLDTYISIFPSFTQCITAALEGLSPLYPFLSGLKLTFPNVMPILDATLVHALSPLSAHIGYLKAEIPTVTPEAWAALPSVLPAMARCQITVSSLSEPSIKALGDMCRSLKGASGAALGSIMLRLREGREGGLDRACAWKRTQQQLEHLMQELAAVKAPVQLWFVDAYQE